MNKKANTVLFLIVATVVNLLILLLNTVVLTSLFIVLYRNVEEVPTTQSWIAIIVILFGSIILTFLVYTRLVRWVTRRWNLDKYLEPLFRPSRSRR